MNVYMVCKIYEELCMEKFGSVILELEKNAFSGRYHAALKQLSENEEHFRVLLTEFVRLSLTNNAILNSIEEFLT